MANITMEEIAKRAGVSRHTVSKIINNRDSYIGKTTKDKVLASIRDLNYQPNYYAKTLKMGKSHCIGLMSSINLLGSNSAYFSKVTAGIETEVEETKSLYTPITFSPSRQATFEKTLELVQKGIVDGLILILLSQEIQYFEEKVLPIFNTTNLPYVVIHSTSRELSYNNVGLDAITGGYLAGKHLLQLGYQDLGYYFGKQQAARSTELFAGLKKACRENAIPLDDIHIIQSSISSKEHINRYQYAYLTFKNLSQLPRAIFFSNDAAAYGATKAIKEQGLQVPEDVAVLGFDDVKPLNYPEEDITTLHHPFAEKGKEGFRILTGLLDGTLEKNRVHRKIVKPYLKVRKSCGYQEPHENT